MAKILVHPKNRDQKNVKKHIKLDQSHQRYKSLYQTFFFLFVSSALINFVLLVTLGHYLMVR